MTTLRVIELDTLFLLTLSAVVGTAFAMSYNHKPNISSSFAISIMQNSEKITPIKSPIPTATPAPIMETFSQISPDGTKMVTMKSVTNKDISKTYTFTTSDSDNTNQQSIYTTILPSNESLSIPFNTWSPDNKYVFLQHNMPSGSEAIVMNANGQPIVEGEQYFNVTTLFAGKSTGNVYQETTGWASETLLIVNTTRQEGTKGPSYWFEVPSKAIIQLSTEF